VGNPQQADVNYNNGQIIAQDGPGLNSGLVPSARETLPGQVRPQPNAISGQSGIFPTPPSTFRDLRSPEGIATANAIRAQTNADLRRIFGP